MVAMGASAGTAATIASVATYAGAAATVLGGITQAQAAKDQAAYGVKVAQYNATNAENAALTNKNLAEAQANEEEARAQIAANEKRRQYDLQLSRAVALNASQGGGDLPENIISGIVDRGETSAQYDLYTGHTRASNIMFQADNNLITTRNNNASSIALAQAKKNQADSAFMPTVLGSLVKGAAMSQFLPGKPPGFSYSGYGGGEGFDSLGNL